jgi:hypothetical protein
MGMRCDEFEARLNDLLDLRLDPAVDVPLAEHAEDCGHCRTLLAAYGNALLPATLAVAHDAPVDLARRVYDRCGSNILVAPRSSSRWYVPHVAAAAAVALVALYLDSQPPQPSAARPVAKAHAAAEEPLTDPVALPASMEVASDSDSAFELWPDLSYGASGAFSDVGSLWPAKSIVAVAAPIEPLPSLGQPQVIAELASGLKPLADSATGAMVFLLDVLPAERQDGAGAIEAPPHAAPAASSDEAI